MNPIEASAAASGNSAPRPAAARDDFAAPHGSDAVDVGALQGVTILLVEDDRVSREALEYIFTYYGARVFSTDSVNGALDSFDRKPPSILVSDIGLASGDGYTLLQAIRTREGDRALRTPAIAVSGYPSRETSQRAHQAGFDAFLRKPVEIRRLLKLVADMATAAAA